MCSPITNSHNVISDLNVHVFGVNHTTCPIELREKVYFKDRPHAYNAIAHHSRGVISEAVILSTCNRSEIYFATTDSQKSLSFQRIKRCIEAYHSIELDDAHVYFNSGTAAVRHLFNVISGLNSLVIGETQIAGQVKSAYFEAKKLNYTGKTLNRLFKNAFQTNKNVRSTTDLGKGTLSISHAAVDLSQRMLSPLSEKNILLVGAGKIVTHAIERFKKLSPASFTITNRTDERSKFLASTYDLQKIPFETFHQYLSLYDIVVFATAANHFLLEPCALKNVLSKRNSHPLFLIDLGVPRNINPECSKVNNVVLRNIDDLQQISQTNMLNRQREIKKADKIVDYRITQYLQSIQKNIAFHEKQKLNIAQNAI